MTSSIAKMRKLEANSTRVGIHWKRCRAHRSRSAKDQCRASPWRCHRPTFWQGGLGVNCRCTSGTAAASQLIRIGKPVVGEIVAGDGLYQPTMAKLPMVPSSSHSPDHHFLLSAQWISDKRSPSHPASPGRAESQGTCLGDRERSRNVGLARAGLGASPP
jgi:hypothetical protein